MSLPPGRIVYDRLTTRADVSHTALCLTVCLPAVGTVSVRASDRGVSVFTVEL